MLSLNILTICTHIDINNFRCCLIDKCCKKKVTMEFRCPTCGIQYTVQSAGHAAILKLLIKGSEMTVFTTFTECINQLLSSRNIAMDLSNKEETLKSLKASLPIKVSYSFTGTKVTKLKKLWKLWTSSCLCNIFL